MSQSHPQPIALVPTTVAPTTLDAPVSGLGLQTLWNSRWPILMITVLCALLGGVYAYRLAIPVYRTHAIVMLDPQEHNVVDLGSVLSALSRDEVVVTTQLEVIRSRRLLGKLVTALNLTRDPEFNTRLRPPAAFAPRAYIKAKLIAFGIIPAPVIRTPDQTTINDETVNAVLKNLTITNLPSSLIFSVSMESRAPEKSALIANKLVELYIQDQLDAKLEATDQATLWLTNRVADLKLALEDAEAASNRYRSSIDPISATTLFELERHLVALRQRLSEPQQSTPELRADLQLRVAKLEADYTKASESLTKQQHLTREVEASRLIYEYFLGRLKETSIQQGVQHADARLLSHAIIPTHAAAPKKTIILLLSALLGFAAAAGISLARAQWYTRFRSFSDLENATGIPVLGQIPQLEDRKANVIEFAMRKPSSILAEAIRDLRTSVLLSSQQHPPQVIVVTSSVPHEGKSTTSIMMAQNMANWGKKVLLIEGDIRRRTFETHFKVQNQQGILSVLAGICPLADAILRPDGMSVDVLVGEASSTNAADIFATSRFTDFLREMRSRYDYIVIDTPPVLVVTDARVIAPSADAVVYAVHWNSTTRAQLQRGIQMFRTVKIPITGLVLTRVNQRKMESYGYGKHYGNYARKSQYYQA